MNEHLAILVGDLDKQRWEILDDRYEIKKLINITFIYHLLL